MHTYNCQFTYRVMMTKEEAQKSGFKTNDYAFIDNDSTVTFITDVCPKEDEIASKAIFELRQKGINDATIIHVFHPEKI